MRALLNKTDGADGHTIDAGALTVDTQSKTARVAGVPVELTNKEYQLLELLSLRGGGVLSKQAILQKLYGSPDAPKQKVIDVFICNLRKKLAAASGGRNFIETIRGRGYALRDSDGDSAMAS